MQELLLNLFIFRLILLLIFCRSSESKLMMMNSSTKQEAGDTNNTSKISRTTTPSSSSRQSWAAFKNPRIVRVSRTFGGKDRHSKVCTVRGLRDRRIRLSVPTAIQLYDLQERLGLSQPSKVVDWLIDATTHEIEKLPPLQIPPASLSHLFNQNNNTPYMKDGVASNEQEGIIGSNCVDLFPAAAGMPFNNWELPNSNLCLAPFGNHSFLSQQNQNQLYFCPTLSSTYMASQHPTIVPTLQLISSQMKSFNEGGNKWLNSRENADKHSQGS